MASLLEKNIQVKNYQHQNLIISVFLVRGVWQKSFDKSINNILFEIRRICNFFESIKVYEKSYIKELSIPYEYYQSDHDCDKVELDFWLFIADEQQPKIIKCRFK